MASVGHDAPLTHGRFDLSGLNGRVRPPHQCECRYPSDDRLALISPSDASDATIADVLSDLGQAMACTLITDDAGCTDVQRVDWDVHVRNHLTDARADLVISGCTAMASFTVLFSLVPCVARGTGVLVSEGSFRAPMAVGIIPEVLNGVVRYWPMDGMQVRRLHHMLQAARTDLVRIGLACGTAGEHGMAKASSGPMAEMMALA